MISVAECIEDNEKLIEAGFEYVTNLGNLKIYRK